MRATFRSRPYRAGGPGHDKERPDSIASMMGRPSPKRKIPTNASGILRLIWAHPANQDRRVRAIRKAAGRQIYKLAGPSRLVREHDYYLATYDADRREPHFTRHQPPSTVNVLVIAGSAREEVIDRVQARVRR